MIRRWDKSRPPTGLFAVNRDSILAQGLVALYWMGGASGSDLIADLAGTYALSKTGTVPFNLGLSGEPVTTYSGSTSNYFSGLPSRTVFPISLTVRCVLTASQTSYLVTVCNSASSDDYFGIPVIAGPGAVRMQWGGTAGGDSFAASSANYVVGQQLSIVGTVTDATHGSVYLNGGNKGTYAGPNSNTPSGINTTSIGLLKDSGGPGPRFPVTGNISECAVYNYIVDDNFAVVHGDPGRQFELYYPLRSRKWISTAVAPAAITGPLINFKHLGGGGALIGGRLVG